MKIKAYFVVDSMKDRELPFYFVMPLNRCCSININILFRSEALEKSHEILFFY